MTYPDRVTVYHKLHALPSATTDAFTLDVLILSEKQRRAAARCLEDIVFYDYRAGGKISLAAKPFMLDAFRTTFRLQEAARDANCRRRDGLEREVRALEMASWDAEGAQEDFGGGGGTAKKP